MFKLVAVLAIFVAVANAGIISHGHVGQGDVYAHAAPVHYAVAAPIDQHHHHASSYANHNSVSVHPVPVHIAHHAAQHAHVVHAPVAHVAVGHGHGHQW